MPAYGERICTRIQGVSACRDAEQSGRVDADAAMFVSCIVLLWLVGLTCVDVVGRYFFRAPVTGAAELVQISMAGIIFFALPAMFLRDDQVIVDLFSVVRRGWFGWVVSLAFAVTTVIAVYIVAARVSGYALRAWEDGDVSIYLKIPTYLVVYAITILIHLLAFCSGACCPNTVQPRSASSR